MTLVASASALQTVRLDWSNAVEEIWPARRSPAFTPFTASESGLAKLPKSEHDWTGFDYRP